MEEDIITEGVFNDDQVSYLNRELIRVRNHSRFIFWGLVIISTLFTFLFVTVREYYIREGVREDQRLESKTIELLTNEIIYLRSQVDSLSNVIVEINPEIQTLTKDTKYMKKEIGNLWYMTNCNTDNIDELLNLSYY